MVNHGWTSMNFSLWAGALSQNRAGTPVRTARCIAYLASKVLVFYWKMQMISDPQQVLLHSWQLLPSRSETWRSTNNSLHLVPSLRCPQLRMPSWKCLSTLHQPMANITRARQPQHIWNKWWVIFEERNKATRSRHSLLTDSRWSAHGSKVSETKLSAASQCIQSPRAGGSECFHEHLQNIFVSSSTNCIKLLCDSSGLVTLFPCILEAMTFREKCSFLRSPWKNGGTLFRTYKKVAFGAVKLRHCTAIAPIANHRTHQQRILASGASERRPSTRAFPFRLGMVKLPPTPVFIAKQLCFEVKM